MPDSHEERTGKLLKGGKERKRAGREGRRMRKRGRERGERGRETVCVCQIYWDRCTERFKREQASHR